MEKWKNPKFIKSIKRVLLAFAVLIIIVLAVNIIYQLVIFIPNLFK